jgi:hypothetical protein
MSDPIWTIPNTSWPVTPQSVDDLTTEEILDVLDLIGGDPL